MKKSIFVLVFALIATTAWSQSIDVTRKLGKVSEAEVAMTTYDKDTTATALYLWENESVTVEFGGGAGLRKHISRTERIKILKDEGKNWADYSFTTNYRYEEAVSKISVTTYNMVDGKVVATKMPKSAIYKTDAGENSVETTFSAMDVKAGSVIEVYYEITTMEYFNIGTHYFQHSIPANVTEFTFSTPGFLKFRKNSKGSIPIKYEDKVENGNYNSGGQAFSYEILKENYTAVDVPAMKPEPHVYNLSQFMSSVAYDVYALDLPGAYKSFTTAWKDVDKAILESNIHNAMNSSCRFKSEVDAIMAVEGDKLAKADAIRQLVLSKITWNNNIALVPSLVGEILKSGTGDTADINAIYASALKHAGYEVEPVMIRTRSRGIIVDFHPSMSSFNTFVLKIYLEEGKSVVVDAARKNAYFNVLPDDYLVEQARIPRRDGLGTWEDLTKLPVVNRDMYLVSATVGTDNTLSGSLTLRYSGGPSYMVKGIYSKSDDEDAFIEHLENAMGVEIDDIKVSGMDTYSDNCEVVSTISKSCDASGGLIYVPAFIDKIHDKSKFKNPDRKFPVEFPFPQNVAYSASIVIPDGYVVEQMPVTQKLAYEALGISVIIQSRQIGNMVNINYRYTQIHTFLPTAAYGEFREFWEVLCSLYDSMIVLKKVE